VPHIMPMPYNALGLKEVPPSASSPTGTITIDEPRRKELSVEALEKRDDPDVYPTTGPKMFCVNPELPWRQTFAFEPSGVGAFVTGVQHLPTFGGRAGNASATGEPRVRLQVFGQGYDGIDISDESRLLRVRRSTEDPRHPRANNMINLLRHPDDDEGTGDVREGEEVTVGIGDIIEVFSQNVAQQEAPLACIVYVVVPLAVLPDTALRMDPIMRYLRITFQHPGQMVCYLNQFLTEFWTKCLNTNGLVDCAAREAAGLNATYTTVRDNPAALLACLRRRGDDSATSTSEHPLPPPPKRPRTERDSILTQPTSTATLHSFHNCMVKVERPTEMPRFRFYLYWEDENQWWHTDRKTTLHELSWNDASCGTCIASWGPVRKVVKCLWQKERPRPYTLAKYP